MFFQPPSEENASIIQTKQEQDTSGTSKTLPKSRRRRKKKPNKKNKQLTRELQKKKYKFALTMSSWAESFTVAATWQLKHQLAHWKARAKALEYENKVLHDVIRKNCLSVSQTDLDHSDAESEHSNHEIVDNDQVDEENFEGVDNDEDFDEEKFEVSEEFIEFVRANAKFKEDARRERERLKANRETAENCIQSPPVIEDCTQRLKDLYGNEWQRIGAFEMGLQSLFMEEADRDHVTHWPVIPFNFNFS